MPKPGGGNGGGGNSGGGISGNKWDNLLTGTASGEVIDGKAGNDTLVGQGGDDTLIGGSGTDTAVFSGNRDDYTVTDLGNGTLLISGPDGTDTVSDVELFQFDDMTQTAAEVILSRLANLAASGLALDDTQLAPGEGATASFTLTSDGSIGAGATTYELLIASAPDAGSVLQVIDSGTASALATGDSATLTATIPADSLAPGTYWVAVRADAGDALAEEDETDNLTQWVQITVEAPVSDFRLSASVDPTSDFELGNDAVIRVDYTLENVSTAGTGGYRLVSVLSQDGTISADDILIGETTGTLAQGGTLTGTLSGRIDEATQPGGWQVLTAVEWTGGETEATPADNLAVEAVTLNAPTADLFLSSATLAGRTDLDLTGGGELQVTYGYGNAGTSSPTWFKITSYLSTDATISADDMRVLGITGGIHPEWSGSVTTSHYFQESFAPGDYYLISVIDWGNDVPDGDYANNTIIQTVTFTPPQTTDLAVQAVTLDPSSDLVIDENGVSLTYDIHVANLGTTDETAGLTAWFSTDTSITADDIRIPSGSLTLTAGDNGTVTVTADLGADLAAGDYHLIVALDAPDDDNQNNLRILDVTLQDPATPPILGTEDADLIPGTAGDDLIYALGGDDTVLASAGFDQVDGGEGTDTVDFSGLAAVRLIGDYYEPGSFFSENLVTYGAEQTYAGFERIIATGGDDFVSLYGTTVRSLDLGGGNDLAEASEGDDTVNGGAGNDLIVGGDGDDLITLGEGTDAFGVFRFDSGQFITGQGNDVITDFNTAEDLLYFQINYGTTYDPLADTTQTAEGALISYGDNASILLAGVDMADLTADHFVFDESIYTSL